MSAKLTKGGGDGSPLSRYDKWRCNYPQYDDTQIWAKVPSQEWSDAIEKSLKRKAITSAVKRFKSSPLRQNKKELTDLTKIS